jgi:Tol biopolymer transport system component
VTTNFAVAVERDKALAGPPRLQHLDLLAQEDSEIATLEGYEGGLTISPSGKLAAYYVDRENLEVRDLTAPTRVARIRLGPGAIQWSPDETRLLFKRAPERKTAELCWIAVPPLATPAAGHEIHVAQPDFNAIFHGSMTRDFAISPDGKYLAVIFPGKRNLDLFPLQ